MLSCPDLAVQYYEMLGERILVRRFFIGFCYVCTSSFTFRCVVDVTFESLFPALSFHVIISCTYSSVLLCELQYLDVWEEHNTCSFV